MSYGRWILNVSLYSVHPSVGSPAQSGGTIGPIVPPSSTGAASPGGTSLRASILSTITSPAEPPPLASKGGAPSVGSTMLPATPPRPAEPPSAGCAPPPVGPAAPPAPPVSP